LEEYAKSVFRYRVCIVFLVSFFSSVIARESASKAIFSITNSVNRLLHPDRIGTRNDTLGHP